MIVVDTSVWIAARRDRHTADILRDLIDADEAALALPVRLELWAGVAKQDRKRHTAAHNSLPQLVPTEHTWAPLTDWIARAGDAGETFTITDLLIASLTAEIGGLVWSLDQDFERMESLGFMSRYIPS